MKSSKVCFFLEFFCPLAVDLADAGEGKMMGGKPFRTILVQRKSSRNSKYSVSFFKKVTKNYCLICSYIQKMKLNLIETFKTSIYNSKHTRNIKTRVNFLTFSKNEKSVFSQKEKRKFRQFSVL